MRWMLLVATLVGLAPHTLTANERRGLGTFDIDTTEVTIQQFRTFVTATGLVTSAERAGGGSEFAGGWVTRPGWTWQSPVGAPGANDEPAVHVTWAEARAYCSFVKGRLATAAEWRLAAYTETRAVPTDGFITGKTYPYPVGDTADGMNTNRRNHVIVGTTRRGVNGLYDMGANVWEWLEDREGDTALTAGGSWWYGPDMTQADRAQWKSVSFAAVYIGFRCAYAPR
jgi:formylglycine-generating enzyme